MAMTLQVYLRGSRDDGGAVGASEWLEGVPLGAVGYPVEGLDAAERAVLVEICDAGTGDFSGPEPGRELAAKLDQRLVAFARDLGRHVPAEKLDRLRRAGVEIDLFISVDAPSELVDLRFPPEFLAALGTRGIPLVIAAGD